MGCNHLPDAVGVDDAREEHKGHQVAMQNVGLQEQIGDHERPGGKEGEETDEGVARAVAAGAAGAYHVASGFDRVVDEHYGALDHVPFGKGEIVKEAGQSQGGGAESEGLGNAKGGEHALLPGRGAAEVTGQGVNAHEDQDTLNGSVDDAEGERLSVVLIPGLDVESEKGGKDGRDGVPTLAHVLRGGEDKAFERGVEGVDAMIEELAKRSGLTSTTTVLRFIVSLPCFRKFDT